MNIRSARLQDIDTNILYPIDKDQAEAKSWKSPSDVYSSRLYNEIEDQRAYTQDMVRALEADTNYKDSLKVEYANMEIFINELIKKNALPEKIAAEKDYQLSIAKNIETLNENIFDEEKDVKELIRAYGEWKTKRGNKIQKLVNDALNNFTKIETESQHLQTSAATRTANTPLAQMISFLKSAASYLGDAEVSQMITSSLLTYGFTIVTSHIGSLGMFANTTSQIEAPVSLTNSTRFSM